LAAPRICVVDTTFARVDMGGLAVRELERLVPGARVYRRTVPGLKDVPVEVLRMVEEYGCDAAMALGWVGGTMTDKYTYLVYSMSLQLVQLMKKIHVIDVTVHEDEAGSEEELYRIAVDRVRKHAYNLYLLLLRPSELTRMAGTGRRQGGPDAGPLRRP